MIFLFVLYFIVLYCIFIVLFCIMLCCIVLCFIVLCCIVFYFIFLYCVVLYCIVSTASDTDRTPALWLKKYPSTTTTGLQLESHAHSIIIIRMIN